MEEFYDKGDLMKVMTMAASLRKDSLNRKLITLANDQLKINSGVTVDACDFHQFAMSVYDGDEESSSGLPAGAKEFVRHLNECQALIISTPEYNGGIPGSLKNAIDWASRSRPIPFTNKPVLLMGASPGGFGAVRGLWHTRVPLEAIGTFVYPSMFGLPHANEAFDAEGKFVDSRNNARLEEIISGFLKFARALQDFGTRA